MLDCFGDSYDDLSDSSGEEQAPQISHQPKPF